MPGARYAFSSGPSLKTFNIPASTSFRLRRWRMLTVGAFGPEENGGNFQNAAVGVLHENDPVGAYLLAETSLPSGSLERLDVAPLGVVLLLEFIDGTRDPLPHVAG